LDKEKESTARIVLFKQFDIKYSFTCEATFFGSDNPLTKEMQGMKVQDYMGVGKDLCITLSYLSNSAYTEKYVDAMITYLRERFYQCSLTNKISLLTPVQKYGTKITDGSQGKLLQQLIDCESAAENEDDANANDISSTDSEDNLKMLLKETKTFKKIRSISLKKKFKKRKSHKVTPDSFSPFGQDVSPNLTRNTIYYPTQTQARSYNKPFINRQKKSMELINKDDDKEVSGNETPLKVKKQPMYRMHLTSSASKNASDDNLTNFNRIPPLNKDNRIKCVGMRSMATIVEERTYNDSMYIGKNSLFKSKRAHINRERFSKYQHSLKLSIVGKKKLQTPILLEYEKLHSSNRPIRPLVKKAETLNQDVMYKQFLGLLVPK
jgi:uncharacterized protein (UPF0305 family)